MTLLPSIAPSDGLLLLLLLIGRPKVDADPSTVNILCSCGACCAFSRRPSSMPLVMLLLLLLLDNPPPLNVLVDLRSSVADPNDPNSFETVDTVGGCGFFTGPFTATTGGACGLPRNDPNLDALFPYRPPCLNVAHLLTLAEGICPKGLRFALGPMLMYLGSKRLKPLPETFLGSSPVSSGTGEEEAGNIDGDTFELLLVVAVSDWCCAGSDDMVDGINLGELFLRVALLPALRLQAGESQ